MMNTRKPASPFGSVGQPQGGGGMGQSQGGGSPFGQISQPQNNGQYGANASPDGNGYGQQFMQQYGAPPGQMRDEWNQFRQDNGIGGGGMGQPQGGGGSPFGSMGQGMGGMGGQPPMGIPMPPQQMQPQQMQQQNPMYSWLQNRPQFGQAMGGQGGDRMSMLRAWLAQRNRGLLGQ